MYEVADPADKNDAKLKLPLEQYRQISFLSRSDHTPSQIADLTGLELTAVQGALRAQALTPTWRQRREVIKLLKQNTLTVEQISRKTGVELGSVKWTQKILLPLDERQASVRLLMNHRLTDEQISEVMMIPIVAVKYFRQGMYKRRVVKRKVGEVD